MTSQYCYNISKSLVTHSDHNAGWFSIEKNKHFADNIAIVWVALDDFPEDFIMDVFVGSHKLYEKYYNTYNNDLFCDFWQTNGTYITKNYKYKRLQNLKPGTTLIMSGGTWHRLYYSSKCTKLSCRRLTLRYADGIKTKWRNDIKIGDWPILQSLSKPNEYLNKTLPIVYPNVIYNSFVKDKVFRADFKDISKFIWNKVVSGGSTPTSLRNSCPHRTQEIKDEYG